MPNLKKHQLNMLLTVITCKNNNNVYVANTLETK